MRSYEFLVEKRRNADINNQDRGSLLDRLKSIRQKYPSDMIYVRFIDFEKLGINSRYSFYTPAGIYGYPIDFVIQKGGNMPFAGNRSKIIVFRVKNPNLMLNLDVANYREVAKRIHDSILKLYGDDWDFSRCSNNKEVWYCMYNYIKTVGLDEKQQISGYKILKNAGYHGAMDTVGIIHTNDYQQGFFFYVQDLQVLDIIENNPLPKEWDDNDYYLIDLKTIPHHIQNKHRQKVKDLILKRVSQFQDASKLIKNDTEFLFEIATYNPEYFIGVIYKSLSDKVKNNLEFVQKLFDYCTDNQKQKETLYYRSTNLVKSNPEILKSMLLMYKQLNKDLTYVDLDFETILSNKELSGLSALYIPNFTAIIIYHFDQFINDFILKLMKINCAMHSGWSNRNSVTSNSHDKDSLVDQELLNIVNNSDKELITKYQQLGKELKLKLDPDPYKDPIVDNPWEEMPWD